MAITDLEHYIDIKKIAVRASERLRDSYYKTERAKQNIQNEIEQDKQILEWLEELVRLRKEKE